MMSNIGTSSSFDSSFRLELVPLPVWSDSRTEPRKDETYTQNFYEDEEMQDDLLFGKRKRRSGGSERLAPNILLEKDDDPRKINMVADIIRELRSTDNILITEIGKKGLLEYIQQGLMVSGSTSDDDGNGHGHDDGHNDNDPRYSVCDWELQDEESFRYLMELLQANMIYFLKRRYFDLERCRYHHTTETKCHPHDTTGHHQHRPHENNPSRNRSNSIAEDFKTIFDKASSTRYLSNREHIAIHCFRKPYQKKRRGGTNNAIPREGPGLFPKTIQMALVRLHRRAGIYLPPTGARSHPSSYSYSSASASNIDNASRKDGVDAYWIDMWRVCSSLLVWILEPCLKITRSMAAPPMCGSPFDHQYPRGDCSFPHHANHECHARHKQQQLQPKQLQGHQHRQLQSPNKKRRIDGINDDDPAGFAKQSHRVSRIPFELIRTEAQKVGLFFDRVLLHDGLWDEEIDEDYKDKDADGDNEGDDYDSNTGNDDTGKNDNEHDGNGSDAVENVANGEENYQNQGERKGENEIGKDWIR
jgi:hypothetical protein